MNDIPLPGWLHEQPELPAWLAEAEVPGWLRNPHPAPGHSPQDRAERERLGIEAMDRANRQRAARLGLSAHLSPIQETLRRQADAIYSRPAYAVNGSWRGPIMGQFVPSELRPDNGASLIPRIY